MNEVVTESRVMSVRGLPPEHGQAQGESPCPPAGARFRSVLWLWLPTLSMMLATLISYVDRNTLALLAPTILGETRLSAGQYGLIFSVFSISYVVGNLIWGLVLDRVGVFWALAGAVALWSAASAGHAFASGFLGFAVARGLLGFAEGATFPGAVRTVVQTLPASRRSRGIALAYSGGTLGALFTPLLVTPIAAHWGWRAAFWATGVVGGAWLLAWLLQGRRRDLAAPPRTGPGAGRPATGIRWTDRRLGSFLCIYAAGVLPLAFVLYAAPLFLGRALGMSQTDLGRVLWIPPLGGELGLFFWSWATERLAAHGRSLWGLRLLFGALALLSLPLALAPWVGSPGLVVGALSFAMFIATGFIVTALAYGTSSFPAARSGLVGGLASASWSMLVAVAMPFFGTMFDQSRYATAFAAAAGAPLVGFAVWWVLNRAGTVVTASPGRRPRPARCSAR
jgi:ACS family hexuronate transporter-like MFS transporter